MKFGGKVAIVTGSSRGIGREIALLLAGEGANVVVNCSDSPAKGNEVARKIGRRAIFVQADVSTEAGARRLVTDTIKKFGKVHILVNNAGKIPIPRDWKADVTTWHNTIDSNLTSAWLMIKEVAPLIEKAGGGVIINITSIYGYDGPADTLAYSVAKGGLITLTKSFARELAPKVRVNAIAPGNVITEMTRKSGRSVTEMFDRATPLKRSATVKEIGKVALFLASDDSSYVTGEILTVDGGYRLR